MWIEPHLRKSVDQSRNPGMHFLPRDVQPQTAMLANTKTQMRLRLAVEIKHVRSFPTRRIAVGCR